jgi:cytochrome b subunit of formate dehydrogenase
MSKTNTVSRQTRSQWLIDAAVFLSGIIAALSGVYFLYLPSGGYQGGRNPMYGVTILFDRHTWDDLHVWSGIAMIAVIIVHLAIHGKWVVGMARHVAKELTGHYPAMNSKTRFNLLLNSVGAISFLLTAVSGLYFFFVPEQAGRLASAAPLFLFSRSTWDLMHTWAGIVLIAAVVVHLAIHWRWIVNVTGKVCQSLWPGPVTRWNERLATQ